MDTRCVQCGTEMKESRQSLEWDLSGVPVTIEDSMVLDCPKCGEQERGLFAMEALVHEVARHIARSPEQLAPAEIRLLRKSLGLSAVDLARKMDADKATVSRWETGAQPMGGMSERLLRLMVLTERPVEEYPLEEMATEPHRRRRITANHGKKGWSLQAA